VVGTLLLQHAPSQCFVCLKACRHESAGELDQAARIVLATDNDGPGQALAEELSRRLGRERCWRVRWPGTAPDPAQVCWPFPQLLSESC
jgi:Toprim domain